jgi:hypothetical protein
MTWTRAAPLQRGPLRPASLSSFPNTLSEFRQCEAWFNGPAKTRLAQVGIDLATRAAILGHSSVRNYMQGSTWRRGGESNSRIKVLQTSPLPLGYRALLFRVTCSPEVGKMPAYSARPHPGLSRQKADN